MNTLDRSAAGTRPTPGYLYTLSAACVGLTFLGIGLGGGFIGRIGGDPIRVMDVQGLIWMMASFAIAFATRLTFWPRAAEPLRHAVRIIVSLIFLIGIPVSVISLVIALTLSSAKHASLPIYFSILALLCQIGSVLWLVRYRREGL